MLKRFANWTARLDEFIESRREMKFQWGKNDCALFAADAVKAITEVDLAEKFRGYSTELGALKAIREFLGTAAPADTYGLRELAEKIASDQGIAEIKPSFAQRGDVVLLPNPLGVALGVVSLHGRYAVSIGHDGMIALPTLDSLKAWRI